MSSLAPAPEAAGSGTRQSAAPESRRSRIFTGESPLALGIAAALCVLAFTTKSGGGLAVDGADVWAQIILVLGAAFAGIAAVLAGHRLARRTWAALLAFATLAVVSYASIAWSVQPAISWFEADRTLSYLAAFALGVLLARGGSSRGEALAAGIGLYTVIVCGWALLARVFPGALDASDTLGRLGVPFGYFNATGLVAAMGLPVWVWLGTRDRRAAPVDPDGVSELPRAGELPGVDAGAAVASVPAFAVLVTTLLLSYGRGALAAAVLGLALWFAVAGPPRRLSGVLVVGAGAVGGLAIGLWATGQTAISHDYVALSSRISAGHRFGVVLLVALVVLTGAGIALVRVRHRISLGPRARRSIVLGLRALPVVVLVLVIVGLAASSRGFTGEISHLWSSITNPQAKVPDAPGRLGELASSRPLYWGDGIKVGAHAPLAGAGAGGFATAVRRYASDRVNHAHSYVVQTFSDLGIVGLVVSAALLLACLRGWGEGLRAVRRRADGEVTAVVGALLAVAVIFGIHSAIDWTWFVPGCTVPALLCAGWVLASHGDAPARGGGLRGSLRRATSEPLRAGGALAVLAVALLAAWFVWQPLRSAGAQSAAEDALLRGAAGQALTDARTAASALPVDARPHELLASILEALRQPGAARGELLKATQLQPSNPDTWWALGAFDHAHSLPGASTELARAHRLDPYGSAG